MKTALISLLVITVMISTGVALVEPQRDAANHLSHKQANRLVNTASTIEDHLRLASYSGRRRKEQGQRGA